MSMPASQSEQPDQAIQEALDDQSRRFRVSGEEYLDRRRQLASGLSKRGLVLASLGIATFGRGKRERQDDWKEQAACQGMDVNDFYRLDGERGPRLINKMNDAKKICATCPVIENCLDAALVRGELDGVWGGLTPEERTQPQSGKITIG